MSKPDEGSSTSPLDAAREMERHERDDKIAVELEQAQRAAEALAGRDGEQA